MMAVETSHSSCCIANGSPAYAQGFGGQPSLRPMIHASILLSFFSSFCWPASRSFSRLRAKAAPATSAKAGGEGGIRTHGTVAGTRDFQSRRFGHSRTSP